MFLLIKSTLAYIKGTMEMSYSIVLENEWHRSLWLSLNKKSTNLSCHDILIFRITSLVYSRSDNNRHGKLQKKNVQR